MLTFRGPLHDREGRPVSGIVDVTFRIYDAPVGGNLLAGPFGPQTITPEAGIFSATFGPVSGEQIHGREAWLEITAGTSPRARLEMEKVYYDGLDGGVLVGGRTLMVRASGDASARKPAPTAASAVPLLLNGPSSNRLDIVFVGDGYTGAQLGTYAVHAANALDSLLAEEPFASYRTFFNAYRVDVVSNESGVDNDPQGVYRDTALDMTFWCQGIDRLLCVDVGKALQYASSAPQSDYVIAIANSTMYGGTGYALSHVTTVAGGNGQASELLSHETGHGLGNLADEYEYGASGPYSGPEPIERNVSIYSKAAMVAGGRKWARWLGDPGVGFGGLVDTYQGAYYHTSGIYRPTLDSKMRTLGVPYNLPSVEGLILEFYRFVRPIDDATPPGTLLDPQSIAFVDPVDLPGPPLEVTWYLDGNPLPGATQDTLRVSQYPFTHGSHVLSVRVQDNTPFVRDETARDALLTEWRSWSLYNDANVLLQSRPNPFSNETTIYYTLATRAKVTVRIFDISGRSIKTLVDGVIDPGIHQTRWAGDIDSGGEVASGVYFYRIDFPDGTSSLRKLSVLR